MKTTFLNTALLLAFLLATASAAEFSVLTLADSGEGSLRQAVLDANAQAGADTIRFANGVTGTIVLTTGHLDIVQDLTIHGPGAEQLAVSGNEQSRVFRISGGGAVSIEGLTVTRGKVTVAPTDGGGILNIGSTLTLARVDLIENQAVSLAAGVARGGAVANLSGGNLTVIDCVIRGNQALAGLGGTGNTGGIFNAASRVNVHGSSFIANRAIGGPAVGGGFTTNQGSIGTITASTFADNQALAGPGGTGAAFGRAGGIGNFFSTVTVENCLIEKNLAQGGSNIPFSGPRLSPAAGGGVFSADHATLFLSGSIIRRNRVIGGSNNTGLGRNGFVGNALGGGLSNVGTATVTDCIFENNEARGGSGNQGDGVSVQFVGTAIGGGIATSAGDPTGNAVILTLRNVTVSHNRAVGGDGNTGGTFMDLGIGGGIGINGSNNNAAVSSGCTVTISNALIEHNETRGGTGGSSLGGGVGNILGGVVSISESAISHNAAVGGDGSGGNGGSGFGGGLFNGEASIHPSNAGALSTSVVEASSVTHNLASGGTAGLGGGTGGSGLGGGLWSGSSLVISQSRLAQNVAQGADATGGAVAGTGAGGALLIDGAATLVAVEIHANAALGGVGLEGTNGGNGFGGGIFNEPTSSLRLEHGTVTKNHAVGGDRGGAQGIGGGVYDLGWFQLDTSVIERNKASTSHDDYFGMVD